MRVTSIGLYSLQNVEAISFSLNNADPTNQYMVRNILGLDADEIIPKFYGFGLATKNRFYDFGLKAREIVLRVALNPRFNIDESYSDIRDELYKAISAVRGGLITLHFNSEATTVARIQGFITKFEVGYFNALPEVQITIKCDDPIFRAINPVHFKPAELLTVNPIIIPDSLSTAPHGFTMQVTFKAASATFIVQDAPSTPDWVFKIVPLGGFLIGDVLYFSSESSNKYLYMIRSGVTTHLMDRLDSTTVWPVIFPGANTFHFADIANFDWNELEYYPAYWGV